jgi:acyl-CoA synthetase (AMP-forming)/AMP-acid ligase II
MVGRLIQTAKSACQYPLIFKQLWHTPRVQAPDQEIVYRDLKRFTYRQIRERIGRLASTLSKAGVVPGDTVGVLDWDSHRFLEAFFAIPMMGAVLQTVNVRLSPEQIAFTIDHAGASTLLINDEFVGLLEGLKAQLPKVKRLIVMSDRPTPQTGSLSFVGEYESLLAAASPGRWRSWSSGHPMRMASAKRPSRTISRCLPTRVSSRNMEFRRRSSSSTVFPKRVSARSTRRNCANGTVTCSRSNAPAKRSGRKTWATSPLPVWAKESDKNSAFPIGLR